MNISEVIKLYRQRKGLSQPDMAKLAGVHPVTLARWEAGAIPSAVVKLLHVILELDIDLKLLDMEVSQQ